ncbi:MAG: RNA polymerase sporulation sigma factor SigH [Clostridia bacterium]|nr:RNA polymerase sporulation sigma factor SigH [Clostridia bacterium]
MEKPRRSDEELLTLLRGGDQEAEWELYDRYKLLVRARARTFFLVGADHEDLVQEGMLGLYKAVCEFDSSKNASFRSFAELCITRQILTAIKTATRKKHQPLNTYVSLNQPVFEPGSTDRTLLDILSGMGVSDPEEMLIGRENMEAVARDIQKKLSPLEKQVLGLYIEGLSYQQIGQLLHKPPKSIDNAIQRVKKKLEEHLKHS